MNQYLFTTMGMVKYAGRVHKVLLNKVKGRGFWHGTNNNFFLLFLTTMIMISSLKLHIMRHLHKIDLALFSHKPEKSIHARDHGTLMGQMKGNIPSTSLLTTNELG